MRLIVWCKSFGHQAEPEVATQVAQARHDDAGSRLGALSALLKPRCARATIRYKAKTDRDGEVRLPLVARSGPHARFATPPGPSRLAGGARCGRTGGALALRGRCLQGLRGLGPAISSLWDERRQCALACMMPDFLNHPRRKAARLRSLAATATTEAIKTRLLEEAEQHERIAQLAEDPEGAEQEAAQS
jgi:hypothetical protein